MKVEFKESFLKDLRPIKDKGLLSRVKEAIENVEKAQKPEEISNLKKLKGERDYWRIRIGEYRLGVKIEGETVTFIRVLNRKEIYRYFP